MQLARRCGAVPQTPPLDPRRGRTRPENDAQVVRIRPAAERTDVTNRFRDARRALLYVRHGGRIIDDDDQDPGRRSAPWREARPGQSTYEQDDDGDAD